MPRQAPELTAIAVARLTEPGLHFVGGVSGLALQVLPSGGRTWILRATVAGRRRDQGLGGYPTVTLAGARQAAREARDVIRAGGDPIAQREAAKSALRAADASAISFEAAAVAYIKAHEPSWKNAKHRAQWSATLTTYAYPLIGALSVRDIALPHVLSILEPIWNTKTETATRLRGRIELILDWATARGYRDGLNPARWRGHLDKILAKPSKVARIKHHNALPAGEVGEFMQRLRISEGLGARALEFAILTATRSGETRGATWAEIDFATATWTIPAERMKAGREHRVPLSPAVVAILEALPQGHGDQLVFAGSGGALLSDMTLLAVLRRMKVKAVPHGFRSTFRDWAAESTGYPHEVCEMALAHTISNKAEAAYRRGDLFEKRRRLMADWATFCAAAPRGDANISRLRPKPSAQ